MAGRDWTLKEIEMSKYLLTVEKLNCKEIGIAIGRTESSVVQTFQKFGIKTRMWTEEEKNNLEKLVFKTTLSKEDISRKIGRSKEAVKLQLSRSFGTQDLMKLRNPGQFQENFKPYSSKDVDFLIKNYYEEGALFCAKKLSRTPEAIMCKVMSLKKSGVKFESQRTPKWSEFLRTRGIKKKGREQSK